MAAESASMPPINGVYNTQYGQTAESTGAVANSQSGAQQSTTAAATANGQKADPQEIGWFFVEQYYTTLSKTPDKIYLFYSKKSQFVSGVEAEKIVPAVGPKVSSTCTFRIINSFLLTILLPGYKREDQRTRHPRLQSSGLECRFSGLTEQHCCPGHW